MQCMWLGRQHPNLKNAFLRYLKLFSNFTDIYTYRYWVVLRNQRCEQTDEEKSYENLNKCGKCGNIEEEKSSSGDLCLGIWEFSQGRLLCRQPQPNKSL